MGKDKRRKRRLLRPAQGQSAFLVKRCIFCNSDRPLTEEHVLPQWIRRIVGPTHSRTNINIRYTEDGKVVSHKQVAGSNYVMRPRVVCEKHCNGGWMRQLENTVVPFMKPLIATVGPRTITAEQAALLAAWASKTAIVAEYMEGNSRAVPPEARRHLMVHLQPPPSTHIWIGQHETPDGGDILQAGWTIAAQDSSPLGAPRDVLPTETANTTFTGIIVGHMLFIVFFTTVGDRFVGLVPTDRPDSLFNIWPDRGPVVWPPKKRLSNLDVYSLRDGMDRLIMGSPPPD